MSASGINFSGLASGIDSGSIISKLMQVEQIPLQRLQLQQQQIQQKQGLFGQFRSALQAVSTAASSLNSVQAFNPMTAISSTPATATVTVSSDAAAGSYSLSVTKLAQAQKVASAPKADTTSALNQVGTFTVNGKSVSVVATDSLRSIAQKINDTSSGVVASLIDGGANNAYLTLSSNKTGAGNKVQLGDATGDVLKNIGFVTGTAAIREPITNGATSIGITSNSANLSTLFTAAANPTTFKVNGVDVTFDPTTTSLDGLASAINAANTGASARVRSVTDGGKTTYNLDISNASDTPTFDDPNGFLESIGVLQKGYGNQLIPAQDAEFKLDTLSLTSATNTVTTAIPGVTLTLLKANETTPETSTIVVNRDTAAVTQKVKDYMNAYNNAIDFIQQNSQFDKDTFATGPLFGDPVAQQVQSEMGSLIFSNVQGLTGNYTNLTSVGFALDKDGKLTLDEAALTTAITADPTSVSKLFRSAGQGSTEDIEYVSSTNKTKQSGLVPFDVNITQAATKGGYVGEMVQGSANPLAEKLTFNGALFGSTPYSLNLPVGSTATSTVDAINADAKLKDLIVASLDNTGKLRIDSKKYGLNGNLTVVSDHEADATNSGIGVGSLGTMITGLDVAGTINGEAATGAGQFLTGNTGNAKTEGLQIQYKGNSLGSVGTMNFTKGMGSQVADLVLQLTDPINGLLSANDQAFTAELDTIASSIKDLNDRLAQKQTDLQLKFSNMETAIAKMQSQASQMSAMRVSN